MRLTTTASSAKQAVGVQLAGNGNCANRTRNESISDPLHIDALIFSRTPSTACGPHIHIHSLAGSWNWNWITRATTCGRLAEDPPAEKVAFLRRVREQEALPIDVINLVAQEAASLLQKKTRFRVRWQVWDVGTGQEYRGQPPKEGSGFELHDIKTWSRSFGSR